MISRIIHLLVLLVCGTSTWWGHRVWAQATVYRLPLTTAPQHYEIRLQVDPSPERDMFLGRVSITSNVKAITSSIILHHRDLDIAFVSVIRAQKELYSRHEVANNDTHFLIIHLKEPLQPDDNIIIDVTYTGSYYNPSTGLFRDSYKDSDGNIRYMLATHMEPLKARFMFPGYDEPGFRASFQLHVTCPSQLHVVSNTPLDSVEQLYGSNKTVYKFKTTPPMASYLVALAVSDFDYLSNMDIDVEQTYPKEFRTYARSNAKHLLGYSVNIGQKILAALEDYLGLEYDMDKMDNVAVPSFGGAMENWGMVIYGESSLLEQRDEDYQIRNKEGIASIMAHEFAHMWFGDEVTPTWWEYLWLSEGFATYFQYFAMSLVEPSWMTMHQFVTATVQPTLRSDSSASTRPMNLPTLASPQSIEVIFDYIAYGKAGSVIRMMSHVLGEDVFHDSLRRYVSLLSKRNAVPDHLYEAMQAALDASPEPHSHTMSVADVMGSWAEQAGYPLIIVTRNGNTDLFNITQRRFNKENPEESGNELWWIPLNWVTGTLLDFSDTSPTELMPPVPQISVMIPQSQPYVIFNKQQTGFYRIMYDQDNWDAIFEALDEQHKNIHVLNRGQILDDIFEFTEIGLLPYSNATMKAVQYLASETDYHPWVVAETRFNRLFTWMEDSEEYPRLQKMVQNLNAKRLKKLNKNKPKKKDSAVITANKASAIAVSCAAASEDCVKRGLVQMHHIRQATEKQTLSHRGELCGGELCAVLRTLSGSELLETWNSLWFHYTTSAKGTFYRKQITKALPCISSDVAIRLFIHHVLDEDVEDSEVSSLLRDLAASSSRGTSAVLELLETQHNNITERVKSKRDLVELIHTAADHITTPETFAQINQLISEDTLDIATTHAEALRAAQGVARISLNWQQAQKPQLENWLRQHIII